MRSDRKILTNLDLQKIYSIRERCFVNLMNYCNDFDAKKFHGKNTGLIWPKNFSALMISLIGSLNFTICI